MIALFLTLGCKYSQGHVNITIYESCVLAQKKNSAAHISNKKLQRVKLFI